MTLLAGSPGRDVVPAGFPPIDQRGIARPQGPAADIGAVEVETVGVVPLLTVGLMKQGLAVSFSGEPGCTYRLLGSSNLTDWSPVATNSLVNGSLQFVLPMTANTHLFFRAVTP